MSIIRQTSFAGGELSPDYYARSELDRYRIGAKSLLNYIVTPSGKASNRPGTKHVVDVDFLVGSFVAIGSSNAGVSPTGTEWNLYATSPITPYAMAYANGRFVAVGWDGSAPACCTSDDLGQTWTLRAIIGVGVPGNAYYCITWDGTRFWAGGAGKTFMAWSYDGITWNQSTFSGVTAATTSALYYDSANGILVGVGFYTSGTVRLSIHTHDSGATWVVSTTEDNLGSWGGLVKAGPYWVAVNSSAEVFRSLDAHTWTVATPIAGASWYGANVYSDVIVAVGLNTPWAMRSTDYGATWTPGTGLGARSWYRTAHNGTRWVIIGTGNYIAHSTDGVTWTEISKTGALFHGLATRSVTEAVGHRLVPFIFSDEQALVLEFRNKSVRFLLNGSYVMSGASPYQVTTPYLAADLPRLKFAQMGNVITIAHPDYSPRELVRTATSPLTFTFTALTFPAMRVNIPRVVPWEIYSYEYPLYSLNWNTIKYDTTIFTGTRKLYGWLITTICQSLDGARTWESVGNLISHLTRIDTATYPSWLGTWSAATTYAANDHVAFEVGGQIFHFKSLAGGNLNNPPVTGYTTDDTWWESIRFGLGYMDLVEVKPELQWADPDATDCRVINYCIYRLEGSAPGELGFPGLIAVLDKGVRAFVDDGSIGADFLQRPPKGENPFAVYNYDNTILRTEDPSTVVYQDERLIFGGTAERPNYLFMSRTGDWHNFDQYPLVKDDDSITVGLAGRRFEEIRSLIPGRSLLVLTTMSEWAVDGGQPDEPMTPTAISARIRSERGCTWLDGLKVGDDHCLFVQRKGTVVRDLMFDGQAGTYVNRDLSLFSHHLFVGKQVIDWCWAEDPWSVIWAVLDDGTLLSFTFIPEQQVFAWARHEIGGDGVVESICSIPEGEEDAVYVVVRRGAVRSIERFATRQITSATESIFLDGSVSYSFGTATTAITGLTHLAGLVVYALADGLVQGPFTVSSSGTITLTTAALRVHVGLKYNADFESLDCSPGEGKTRVKSVKTAWVELEASAGSIQAGEDFTHLDTWSGVEADETAKVSGLTTGQARIPTISHWNHGGRVCIRQSDPLPITILAVTREVEYGG
jgi:hypothetical protein